MRDHKLQAHWHSAGKQMHLMVHNAPSAGKQMHLMVHNALSENAPCIFRKVAPLLVLAPFAR